ncbi:Peptidase_C39 like family protein [Oribacterium sp. KHPX15]|uniref:C39 family peptidase n=1 Tax=Oribacterium sp. KHPX15 TaxID=1855342 RepID=UPI00089A6CBF|nr:C39 family peptidase [Oribacterium sp. KHPX15]SEA43667.1 Peptidase_C39 like family protein [Oribacterium sp. KHPX15]
MSTQTANNSTKSWDGLNYDRKETYVAGSAAAGGLGAHKTLLERFKDFRRSSRDYIDARKAENQNLKANLTEEEIFLGHALRAGIALSALTLSMSAAYLVHPYTAQDVMDVGKSSVHSVDKTVHMPFDVYREYSEMKSADEAAKKALAAQQRAEIAAQEQIESHLSASGAEGNPMIYAADANGNITAMLLPETLHYVYNDYNSVLDTVLGSMLYFCQSDSHWKDYRIAGVDRMGAYGCGPVTISMLVNSFAKTDTPITPVEVADWAVENKLYAIHGGSYHSLIPEALEHYGLNCTSVTDRTPENVTELLKTGHVLVALMGKGSLTDVGHFVVITQLTPEGDVMIADPAKFANCQKAWPLDLILKELKAAYDGGGPLWAVSTGD